MRRRPTGRIDAIPATKLFRKKACDGNGKGKKSLEQTKNYNDETEERRGKKAKLIIPCGFILTYIVLF